MRTLKPIRPVVRDEKTYQRKLVSFLKVTIQGPLARAVINSTSVADILRFNDQLANEVLNIDQLGADLANEEFTGVAQRHTTKFARSMAGVIPEIGLKLSQQTVSAWLNEKTATNVRLIRGMNENQFVKFNEKLNRLLGAAEFDRQAVAQAAKDAFDVGDSRAKLIGRDQISKATGELNLIRQKEVGITKYRWQTSEDDRVRPTHAANNDKIFSWGEPPAATGHPGEDYQCRCVAIPLLD